MDKIKNKIREDFERIFDVASQLLFVTDINGIFQKASAEWINLFGYGTEEILNHDFKRLVHPDELDLIKEAYTNISGKKPILFLEIRIKCKDGSYKWLDMRMMSIDDFVYIAGNDITEKKETEKEIKDTLQYNSKIFYAAPIGITTYNSKGVCLTVNKAYASFFGMQTEEIMHISLKDLCISKGLQPDGLYDLILTVVKETLLEICMPENGGNGAWFDCYITPFNSKNEYNYLVLLQDITKRKKSENLLKESESRFKYMLNSIKLMSMIFDSRGRIKFMNDYAMKFTGYSLNEIDNADAVELFVKEPESKRKINNFLKAGSFPESFQIEIETKKNVKKTIKVSSTILKDEENNFVGVANIAEDVTEFKLYEKILNFRYELIEKENEKDIDTLIQFTLDTAEELTRSKIGFFLFFEEGKKSYTFQTASTNTIFMSELKFSEEKSKTMDEDILWAECIGKKRPIIHNDFNNLPRKNELPEGHLPIIRTLFFPIIKDNKVVAIIGLGNKETDYFQQDIEIVSLLSDSLWNLIYKKRATDALIKSEEQLRNLVATKDKFFSIIAHDLKSPFQGLLGSLQILTAEFDDLDNLDRKELIGSINNLSQYLYKLLENLLQWSRIQTGKIEYTMQILNLNNLFNDTIALLSSVASTKNITITRNIPENYYVKTDRNVVVTILRNLISNAIKFTEINGIINIYTELKNGTIEIFVEDNGIGMTPEEVDSLFLIHAQSNKKGTSGESGTGLGLILCKEMIRDIGGSINVKSEPGKGSAFSFTLPKV